MPVRMPIRIEHKLFVRIERGVHPIGVHVRLDEKASGARVIEAWAVADHGARGDGEIECVLAVFQRMTVALKTIATPLNLPRAHV